MFVDACACGVISQGGGGKNRRRRQMGLLCADSAAPSLLASRRLFFSLVAWLALLSGLWGPAVWYWTCCKRLTPHPLEPLTHRHTDAERRLQWHKDGACVKVVNYCRAVWSSSAERTKQRNREEEKNKLFYPALIFQWDPRGGEVVQQINIKVSLCQCGV